MVTPLLSKSMIFHPTASAPGASHTPSGVAGVAISARWVAPLMMMPFTASCVQRGNFHGCHAISVEVLALLHQPCDFDCHASYPFLFSMNGLTCMIPETCARRSVDLYVCEEWPDLWHLERRLLFDVDAADTMVLQSGGYWWIITSVRTGRENRHLEIFFTDDLLKGTLHPHPVNNAGLYGDGRNGTGRNAGYLALSKDGKIGRLMQKSRHFYGDGVAAMEIATLNTEYFEEHVVEAIPELPFVTPGFASHHVSRAGDLIAYDTRDRAR